MVFLLFCWLLIIQICVDFLFDLLFDLGAKGVDGDHVLEQADADAAGDAADLVFIKDFPDPGVGFDDVLDLGRAEIFFQVHGFAPSSMVTGEYPGTNEKNMTQVKSGENILPMQIGEMDGNERDRTGEQKGQRPMGGPGQGRPTGGD
jgi:hypothetical protein